MKKKGNLIYLGVFLLAVVILAMSWQSRGFSDLMRRTVFRAVRYIQGHISSIFPFSVGEIMLIAAVLLLAIGVIFIPILFSLWKKEKRNIDLSASKKTGLYRFIKNYYVNLLRIIAVVSLIMVINCFVLYHCSSFQENYISAGKREYTVRELALLRNHVISKCNQLAPEMMRDEKGYILYDGDMKKTAITSMKRLGEQYPLLSGYYTTPKKLTFSGFFSQQYMTGYYFPFSMEANYNGIMYISNTPATLCHELSHTKGFIYEDDANFIGYLACISSEDAFFQYSGYLSVITYLNRDFYESLGNDEGLYRAYPQCTALVNGDNIFLTREAWEEVESRAVLDTETVRKASRSFLETNLQVNGVESGIASYGEVVERLLEYYDGVLY